MTQPFTRACALDDLTPGTPKVAGGVTLFRLGDQVVATENRCPHMGYPMVKGTVRDGVVTCAWHRWEFSLDGGGCLRGAVDDLRVFPVEIRDGAVFVARESAAADLERVSRQLAEALLDSDPYLQAKALARLFAAGATPRHIAEVAAAQAFAHATRAHTGPQAAVELEAIVDALMLSEVLGDGQQTAVALQGVRVAAGPAGLRPDVHPLPGEPLGIDAAAALLERYTADPSELAVERVLRSLSPTIDAAGVRALVLRAATHPWFLAEPDVWTHAMGAARATAWLGGAPAQLRLAAMLGWMLGARRPPPEPDDRDAVAWWQGHEDAIRAAAGGQGACDPEKLVVALDRTSPATCLGGLLDLLADGASPHAVLDAFSVLGARRLARLWLRNGGLWDSASRLVRQCSALRELQPPPDLLARALLHLAHEWYRTRWLQDGRPLPLDGIEPAADLDGTWEELASAMARGRLPAARAAAGALFAAHRDPASAGAFLERFVALLFDEDQGALQLRTVVAAMGELHHVSEPLPHLLGVLGAAIDRKLSQDVAAAARFGRSWAGGRAEERDGDR